MLCKLTLLKIFFRHSNLLHDRCILVVGLSSSGDGTGDGDSSLWDVGWVNGTDMQHPVDSGDGGGGGGRQVITYHASQNGLQGCVSYELRVLSLTTYKDALYVGEPSQPVFFTTPCR